MGICCNAEDGSNILQAELPSASSAGQGVGTCAIWGMQFPHAEGSHSRFAGRKMNQTELGHWRKDPTAVVRGQGQKLEGGCQDLQNCLL